MSYLCGHMSNTLSSKGFLDISTLIEGEKSTNGVLKFLYGQTGVFSDYLKASGDDVITSIRSGLPKSGVDAFLAQTNVGSEQLCRVLHISTRQLKRYNPDQKLPTEQSNFLYELTRVYTRAVDILGDKPTAEHWLGRPQIALGDQSPLQLLDTTEGVRYVDDLLTQIEHGFYS